MVFGWFARPVAFRAQSGQTGRPCIELPGTETGDEKAVLRALAGMGRIRIRSKANEFGHITITFNAAFESYSLHSTGSGAYIRGESGGDEIELMLAFMRKSPRFKNVKP